MSIEFRDEIFGAGGMRGCVSAGMITVNLLKQRTVNKSMIDFIYSGTLVFGPRRYG